jgi:hypothetical protein
MQYWTKEKPSQTGSYWAKLSDNDACVVYVSVSNTATYVTIFDEILLINDQRFNKTLWSNGRIPEPQGLKI